MTVILRMMIKKLDYLEPKFLSGSTIKALEIPYLFGLVKNFQNLLYVLFLDWRAK